MEKTTWVPRNLNEQDILKLGFGIKLKTFDLPFLIIGGVVGNLITKMNYFSTIVNGEYGMIFKVMVITIGVSITYIFVRIKLHGYEMPTLLANRTIYTSRKGSYYLQKRRRTKR